MRKIEGRLRVLILRSDAHEQIMRQVGNKVWKKVSRMNDWNKRGAEEILSQLAPVDLNYGESELFFGS